MAERRGAEISVRPITTAQVRAIHVAVGRAGMDDDAYRALLWDRYGVESCKELTRRQASELLTRLGRPLAHPPGTPPARRRARPVAATPPAEGVVRLATPLQRSLIEELVSEIAWREADGFQMWLEKNKGMKRIATVEEASDVIEALKAMRRRDG